MSECNSDKQRWPADEPQVTLGITQVQEQVLQALRKHLWTAQSKVMEPENHIPDFVLYDLALEELAPEERQNIKGHLADCQECVRRLVAFQAAIATDKEVFAVWEPEVLYAAGGSESVPVIKELTDGGKYEITLQATEDGERDLLTLAVTPSYRERLEGSEFIVVTSKGTLVLHGTITDGTISRFVSRRLRDEWPFRIHAAYMKGATS